MKQIYTLVILLSVVLLNGCSKDVLKSYDKRIVGTWRISDVDRVGFGGNTDNLPFNSGSFTFHENGTLEYVNAANATFKGSWEIIKRKKDDQTVHILQITAIDFTNQQVLTEYYDDMNFTGTNRFKANITANFHVYVTCFSRL
jgi:hypothetical protein